MVRILPCVLHAALIFIIKFQIPGYGDELIAEILPYMMIFQDPVLSRIAGPDTHGVTVAHQDLGCKIKSHVHSPHGGKLNLGSMEWNRQ